MIQTDLKPYTDAELAEVRALTPPDSHPTILRLLATIDALKAPKRRAPKRPWTRRVVKEPVYPCPVGGCGWSGSLAALDHHVQTWHG